ncbi:hypothetical protein [Cohnella thermotolerans]|uniref:hypothetical protein n=1 Tax=Cohnella thermotolerans TaxID=329858 RepID=UPI00041835CA|nr:hypothetical protein [Cohnella thermotolerans]
MTLPHDYTDSPAAGDAFAPVMGAAGPMSDVAKAEERRKGDFLHVNRSTLILSNAEVTDSSPALQYLAEHEEINHVLLTGTDALSMPASRLRAIIERLKAIEHVRMIRLYSRTPAVHPERIAGNEELLDLLSAHSSASRNIYVMMRFHRPEEVSERAIEAFQALGDAGAGLVAEIPLLRGVNADPGVLAELIERLTNAGVIPYQFILDGPGTDSDAEREDSAIPLQEAYRLAESVKARISGPARRARLTIMHPSGYFEILAIENGKAYTKGHLSGEDANGRFMILDCPRHATSFDEVPASRLEERTGKTPSDATYLKVPYEIPD